MNELIIVKVQVKRSLKQFHILRSYILINLILLIKLFLVIWKNVEYNIGNAFNAETGVFTSPYDGIYSFHATSSMIGQVEGHISIRADGSTNVQNYFRNNGDHEYKHINPHGQFRLKKGARVYVGMAGTFYRPSSICHRTYFQGHLIDLL